MKKVLVFMLAFMSSTLMFGQTLHFQADYSGCNALFTKITGVFAINGQQIYNGVGMQNQGGQNIEIGVFDQNDICRFTRVPQWRAKSNQYIYQMSIRGTEGMVYHFKVYDHNTDTELDLVDDFGEVIEYVPNAQIGSTTTPYILNFTMPAISYEKDITGYGDGEGNWYLVSSPIGEVAVNEVGNMTVGINYDLYYFNQSQELEWINYKDTENGGGFNLLPGKGYLYANNSDVTLYFTGTPYDGNGEVTLTKDDDAEFAGWNLVGNPFAEVAYIEGSYYRMNDDGTDLMEGSGAIQPMEGIFVLATEEGEILTFSTTPTYGKSRLALNLSQNGNVIDRAVVNFGKGTLPKFQINPNSTKVYIPVEDEDFAVVSASATGEMPVSFKAAKNGNYTLSFTSQEVSFTYLHLIDNMTGNNVDLLKTPSYTFDASTTDYASRFRLVFATGSSAENDNFGFVNAMGNLCIFGIEGEATIQVVDVLGHVVSSNQFSGSYESKLNVAPGVYMLRLINGNDVKVQKMIVK